MPNFALRNGHCKSRMSLLWSIRLLVMLFSPGNWTWFGILMIVKKSGVVSQSIQCEYKLDKVFQKMSRLCLHLPSFHCSAKLDVNDDSSHCWCWCTPYKCSVCVFRWLRWVGPVDIITCMFITVVILHFWIVREEEQLAVGLGLVADSLLCVRKCN